MRFSSLRQGEDCRFDFHEAAFEKASRVSFHTVRLFPNWFVNVDARKFVFTDIDWQNLDSDWKNENIARELENLKKRKIGKRNKRLLEIAARQLAVNAEENNQYVDAGKFRYLAMETKRLDNEGWRQFINLHLFYKWSSGYGESWLTALCLLLLILLGAGIFYEWFGTFQMSNASEIYDMTGGEGYLYSLATASFQRPEPKAFGILTKSFVVFETILAPLQAALLALAIRRKFMR